MNSMLRWLPRLLLAGCLLCGMGRPAVAAPPAALQQAFQAAFGRAAPVMRRVSFPGQDTIDFSLAPLALVRLGGTRFALIATESFDGAHVNEGAAAVAYLDRDGMNWRPIHVWYEFIYAGSFGTPFVDHMQFHFGGTPFFAGISQYCGMGACTAWYNLIGLLPDKPADWGMLHDQGQLAAIYDDLPDGEDGLIGCGGYAYSSFISPPLDHGDVMRVSYAGWMLPGGGGQKRRSLNGSAEIALVAGNLSLKPALPIPNCGQ